MAIAPLPIPRRPLANVFERFGVKLRSLREAAGVSQEKLADMAGLHRTYVSSVERGQRNISLLNIERLALALEVPLKDLMPDDAKPRPR
jgi:transcriptional regulator with XRE-family HTH domain